MAHYHYTIMLREELLSDKDDVSKALRLGGDFYQNMLSDFTYIEGLGLGGNILKLMVSNSMKVKIEAVRSRGSL